MTKKHKFIDTLKSWLITLGVASVFGLAALGVNATKTYTKTSAYQIDNDYGITITSEVGNYDYTALYNYILQYGTRYQSSSLHYLPLELHSGDFSGGIADEDSQLLTHFVAVPTDTENYMYLGLSMEGISNDSDCIGLTFNTSYWVVSDIYFDGVSDDGFYFSYCSYNDIGYQSLRYALESYNAPQSQGNFLTALSDFMQLLGGAIVQLAQPVANGVTEFARDLFIDNNHLSILGGVIGIFAGIALAVGITTKVYTWVTSLGN